MRIAVLFDGAGLARLGLEQAGHECTGFELNPIAHYLSSMVGSGCCVEADATEVDLSEYEGAWTSPPCQWISSARTQGAPTSAFAGDYLNWCLNLRNEWPHLRTLWVENVTVQEKGGNDWGTVFNAAQFTAPPLQNRNRVVGGLYPPPSVLAPYAKAFKGICPCVTASEYKGSRDDPRRASRFYGRRLTLEECAYHQGFTIPEGWWGLPLGLTRPDGKRFTPSAWAEELYTAIGNGVPVYMARAFGEAAESL